MNRICSVSVKHKLKLHKNKFHLEKECIRKNVQCPFVQIGKYNISKRLPERNRHEGCMVCTRKNLFNGV